MKIGDFLLAEELHRTAHKCATFIQCTWVAKSLQLQLYSTVRKNNAKMYVNQKNKEEQASLPPQRPRSPSHI